MADPIKKEDEKDPVAELITALEAGKKATERLDALEKKILDRIEQAVTGSSSQNSQTAPPPVQSTSFSDNSGDSNQLSGNVFSDDSLGSSTKSGFN